MSILHGIKSLFGAVEPTVIECYREADSRLHRWRAVAANGEILADSGEGYVRIIDMRHTLDRLFPNQSAFPRTEVDK